METATEWLFWKCSIVPVGLRLDRVETFHYFSAVDCYKLGSGCNICVAHQSCDVT